MTSPSGHLANTLVRLEQQASTRRLLLLAALGCFVVAGVLLQIRLPQPDVELYRRYGLATLRSRNHIALPLQYPAAAAAVFALVALVTSVPRDYTVAFGLLMGSVLAVLLAVGTRLFEDHRWALRTLVYSTAGTLAIVMGRYDLLPALAEVIAVGLAAKGRWGGAWAGAAVGAALKLFPALLLPGFFLAEWRSSGRPPWRRVVAVLSAGAVVAGVQVVLAPGTVLSPILYELHRGFEVESVAASLTLLAHPWGLGWNFGFGAWQVVGPYHSVIAAAVSIGQLAGLLGVWVLAWRSRLSVPAVALAVLTVGILGDRAFSPQYLIWLAPLWALWSLRAGWLAAAALTTFLYPISYRFAAWLPTIGVHVGLYPTVAVALVRNSVLIVASGLWLRKELATHQGSEPRDPPRAAISGRSGRSEHGADLPISTSLGVEGGTW